MNVNANFCFNPIKLVVGSAIGFTSFVSVAVAAPNRTAVNPCPTIYYEEPHNHMRPVPMGCPPNQFTLSQNEQEQVSAGGLMNQVMPTQMPLPENQQPTLTTVVFNSGQVKIKLKNMTNTQMIYQAIGHTEQRILTSGAEVTLQNLSAPVSITFLRSDGGLIKVMPVENSEQGVLDLMMHEGTGLNDSQNTVRVQSDGRVVAF